MHFLRKQAQSILSELEILKVLRVYVVCRPNQCPLHVCSV